MRILEKLLLLAKGARLISTDYYGNTYYVLREKDAFGRPTRYVSYRKRKNASNVPPLWSSWLRHSLDDNSLEQEARKVAQPFVSPHQPNLTGSSIAYSQDDKKTFTKIYHSWMD